MWDSTEIILGPGMIVAALVIMAVQADARGKRREKRELEDRERGGQDDASEQPPTG
jgi:hypothetical protein